MASTLPQFMKALVKDKPGVSYEYKDVPVPKPAKGELLIKVNKVAVCGSDIMLYQWGEGSEECRAGFIVAFIVDMLTTGLNYMAV